MIDSHSDAGFGDIPGGAERIPEERQVRVRRVGIGWCVEGDGLERLMFRAESPAERQARGLALGFATCGRDTCVRVHDTEGREVAIIRYYGLKAAGRSPAMD